MARASDNKGLELQVITPDGVKLSERVDELTAPSVDGEFGVLPGHRPLLAALKAGIVGYHKDGNQVQVAVGAGFVEVADDRAIILTDNYTTKGDIDPVRSRLNLKEANLALDTFEGDPKSVEYSELVKKELWAAAELELYGDPPPARVFASHEFESEPVVSPGDSTEGDVPARAPAEH